MPRLKTVVMVPKGAEFQSVQKGLRSSLTQNQETKSIDLVSLPVGPEPVKAFLAQWCANEGATLLAEGIHVVVMGLCGSLSTDLNVGEVVIYERCLNGKSSTTDDVIACSLDVPIPSNNPGRLAVTPVTCVTCDRVASTVEEKITLFQQTQAEVVDMEGFAILQTLEKQAKKISMLRVVSDDSRHRLPDLTEAFDERGNLRPLIIARQFLRYPSGAIRLIKGALTGFRVLTRLSKSLADEIHRQR